MFRDIQEGVLADYSGAMARAPPPPPAAMVPSQDGSTTSDSSGILVEPLRLVEVNVRQEAPLAVVAMPVTAPSSSSSASLRSHRAAGERSREELLKDHRLWDGWGMYYDAIPLGPSKSLDMPKRAQEDPDVVGFAYPLPPVAFKLRNERKHPPPKEHDMLREVFTCIAAIDSALYRRSSVLGAIYNMVDSNKRDSPGWQKCLLQAGLREKLFRIWRHEPSNKEAKEEADESEDEGQLSERYWVMAVLGRMMGTCRDSRVQLIEEGAVEYILEGARDADSQVQECAICALKGLIQHPEGRQVVTYTTLMECLVAKPGDAVAGA